MNEKVIDSELQRKSRMKLLAIFAVFLGPLLLATVWLHYVKNGGEIDPSTKGQLITPASPLNDFTLLNNDQKPFQLDSLKRIWSLVYISDDSCTVVCEKNLYHMRQVRTSLGKNMHRVQRVYLSIAGTGLSDNMLKEHPMMHVLKGSEEQIVQFANQFKTAVQTMPTINDAIYLIDPYGNLMMRFPADLNPKGMLKDVKHLLKVSRIG